MTSPTHLNAPGRRKHEHVLRTVVAHEPTEAAHRRPGLARPIDRGLVLGVVRLAQHDVMLGTRARDHLASGRGSARPYA
jgi:hypothetical protein